MGTMDASTRSTTPREHRRGLVGRRARRAAPRPWHRETPLPPTAEPATTAEISNLVTPERSLGDCARTRWLARHALVLGAADLMVALLSVSIAIALTDPQPARLVRLGCLANLPLLWVASLVLGRVYEHRYLEDGAEDYRRLVKMSARWMGVAGILALITEWELPRTLTLVGVPVLVAGSLVVHSLGHVAQARARRAGVTVHRALVVGTERATAEMIRRLSHRDDHGFEVVGALVDRCHNGTIEGVPVVGRGDDFRAALEEYQADTLVIAAWSILSQEQLRHMSWDLEKSKVEVLVAPLLTDVAGTRITVRPVVGLPLLQVGHPEFVGLRRLFKNAFDRTAALVALLLLSPLLLVLTVAVRMDTPGPAFFRQMRVGRDNTTFRMVKFRSMVVGSELLLDELRELNDHGEGPLFKMKDDPRVTRVGAVLRRYSLDELPQLWNVLLGHMSLVGPRPPLPAEVAEYPDDMRRRLMVKPGMTGLWQVSGRSDLDWDESVRLDLYYVDNWSFLLDMSLLTKTVQVIVGRKGAY